MTLPGEQRVGLIGVDGSTDSAALVNFVRELFHPSWSWIVVHVVDLAAPAHPEAATQVEIDAASIVEEVARLLPGSTAIVEQSPDIANGLRTVASDHNVSVIVIGAGHHSALASALLGSVSSELLKHAPCPVVTFRPH